MNCCYRLVVLLAVLAGVVICVLGAPNQQQAREVTPSESANHAVTRMGGLLDFANYKKLFNKSYSGMLEEAVRLKYFTASAIKTAAAAIKYRMRLINHYLSLNHMSDWTRKEFDKLENKAFAIWASSVSKVRGRQPPASQPASGSSGKLPGANENIAEHERKGEQVYEQLGELLGAESVDRHERKKREAVEDRPLPPRELPMQKLINAGETEESSEDWNEHRLNVKSNNPQFVPAELSTQGFTEDQQPVVWHSLESHDRLAEDLGVMASAVDLSKVKRKIVEEVVEEEPEEENARYYKPNRVFIDLRETGCIAPVRHQLKCGSCYAFTTMAIMEFLYCKNTGQKVAFSEQYMVDCGQHVWLTGCAGGSPIFAPNFVRNFGLYPSALYPYRGEEGQCPYDEGLVNLEQTGYIRSDDFSNSLMIARKFWADALEHGPLMIGAIARAGSDFHLYGGGLLMGDCEGQPAHAVVLIGHGRQEGREYWLIRNSWSSRWGERGYIKVDKECNCIGPDFGLAYGVSNPEQFAKMTFVENDENDAHQVSWLVRNTALTEDEKNAVLTSKGF